MRRTNNKRGLITSRDLLITGAVTLGIAIIIVAAALVFIKRPGTETPANKQDIANIRNRGRGAAGEQAGQTGTDQTGTEEEVKVIKTYAGKLLLIENNAITLQSAGNGSNLTFEIAADTAIVYQGNPYTLADLHIGDELAVRTETQNQKETVTRVDVTLSTSPTVPTQINVPLDEPSVILPPSKRQIL